MKKFLLKMRPASTNVVEYTMSQDQWNSDLLILVENELRTADTGNDDKDHVRDINSIRSSYLPSTSNYPSRWLPYHVLMGGTAAGIVC